MCSMILQLISRPANNCQKWLELSWIAGRLQSQVPKAKQPARDCLILCVVAHGMFRACVGFDRDAIVLRALASTGLILRFWEKATVQL